MAVQLLSLLGGLVRGAAMSLPRAGRAFMQAGRALRRPPGAPATLNLSQLARRLGTPNPSPAQIATAQQQINQQNQQFNPAHRAQQAVGHAFEGVKQLGMFNAALIVATKGLTGLAQIVNNNAVESLKMYSAAMAAESAKKSIFAMQYGKERAQLVQGTTKALGSALRDNSKAWQPYAAAAENAINALLLLATTTSTGFANLLDALTVTKWIEAFNAYWNKEENKKTPPIAGFLKDVLAGNNFKPLSPRPDENPRARMR